MALIDAHTIPHNLPDCSMNTRQIGADGEELAAQYLLKRGFQIIRRNYGVGRGEIDLVTRSPEGILVFVEVKQVNSLSYGNPAWKISPQKLATIGKVAEQFLQEHNLVGSPFRIDAVTITPEKTEWFVNCI